MCRPSKKEKTRIAAIVEYFPPRLGSDRRIYELLKRLPSEEYEVNFIALPPSYTLFIAGINKEPLPDSQINVEGIRGIIIGYPKVLLRLWRKAFTSAYAATLAYVLRKALVATIRVSPDLIVVNNTSVYTGLTGYLLSLITGTRLLVDFNDLESEYTFEKIRNRVPRKLHRAIKLVLMAIENMLLKRSSSVITVHTQFLKKYAENVCDKNVLYVPDGVDMDRFNMEAITVGEIDTLRKELQVEDSKICGYTGRIDRDIGGQILYETLSLLERTREKIKCLILGEGDLDLVDRIRRLDVVVYVGLKPPHEVPRYVALADVILVPYPQTKASHSVSPLKLFEALAMAKPVVTSDVSGIRDVILGDHNGILVEDDPERWVVSIRRVIEDDSLASKLATNALATARRYDWKLLSETFGRAVQMALAVEA